MTSPLIVFRADASLYIGTGHVMRCLTLAAALRERGATCEFVCRAHLGNLIDFVREQGYETHALPVADFAGDDGTAALAHADWLGSSQENDAAQTRAALKGRRADWLVVDHYALDHGWERVLRADCGRLMAIDDLADRVHDCNVLLDQNLGRTPADYAALAPADALILAGPAFALLRPAFAAMRPYSLQRRASPALRRIIVTMGGVDRDNATGVVLAALTACDVPAGCKVTVVIGPHAPWLAQVREQAAAMPFATEVLVNVRDMERLMAESDLAIGAAGSTSWERCALGLPTLLLVLAANQEAVASALERHGAAKVLHDPDQIGSMLPTEFARLQLASALGTMAAAAASVTDGLGVQRMLEVLEV
jgi:UDP-2,4-diacetamido-2,4,6-trideoxy-beta-L-altropyranose hydrolase